MIGYLTEPWAGPWYSLTADAYEIRLRTKTVDEGPLFLRSYLNVIDPAEIFKLQAEAVTIMFEHIYDYHGQGD